MSLEGFSRWAEKQYSTPDEALNGLKELIKEQKQESKKEIPPTVTNKEAMIFFQQQLKLVPTLSQCKNLQAKLEFLKPKIEEPAESKPSSTRAVTKIFERSSKEWLSKTEVSKIEEKLKERQKDLLTHLKQDDPQYIELLPQALAAMSKSEQVKVLDALITNSQLLTNLFSCNTAVKKSTLQAVAKHFYEHGLLGKAIPQWPELGKEAKNAITLGIKEALSDSLSKVRIGQLTGITKLIDVDTTLIILHQTVDHAARGQKVYPLVADAASQVIWERMFPQATKDPDLLKALQDKVKRDIEATPQKDVKESIPKPVKGTSEQESTTKRTVEKFTGRKVSISPPIEEARPDWVMPVRTPKPVEATPTPTPVLRPPSVIATPTPQPIEEETEEQDIKQSYQNIKKELEQEKANKNVEALLTNMQQLFMELEKNPLSEELLTSVNDKLQAELTALQEKDLQVLTKLIALTDKPKNQFLYNWIQRFSPAILESQRSDFSLQFTKVVGEILSAYSNNTQSSSLETLHNSTYEALNQFGDTTFNPESVKAFKDTVINSLRALKRSDPQEFSLLLLQKRDDNQEIRHFVETISPGLLVSGFEELEEMAVQDKEVVWKELSAFLTADRFKDLKAPLQKAHEESLNQESMIHELRPLILQKVPQADMNKFLAQLKTNCPHTWEIWEQERMKAQDRLFKELDDLT